MFSIPIAIIRKKNLPYLSICQEIYFSFKHHTPGVYGNHKTSHSDEEAEAISSAINIFNFCLQHEKKLKSFLNLNPKCCLIVHIWLGLFRRNNSCWCQQCVQWHTNLPYPREHRGHGKVSWQVQLGGSVAIQMLLLYNLVMESLQLSASTQPWIIMCFHTLDTQSTASKSHAVYWQQSLHSDKFNLFICCWHFSSTQLRDFCAWSYASI